MAPRIMKRFSRLWNLGNLICVPQDSSVHSQHGDAVKHTDICLRGWKLSGALGSSKFSKDDTSEITRESRAANRSLRRSFSDHLHLLSDDALETSGNCSDADSLSSRDDYVPSPCCLSPDNNSHSNDSIKSGLLSLPDSILVFILRNIGDTRTLFQCTLVSKRFRQLVIIALEDMLQLSFSNLSANEVTEALALTRYIRRLTLNWEADIDFIPHKLVLPNFPELWRQDDSVQLSSSFLKRRGMADDNDGVVFQSQRCVIDSLQLWLSGPATWRFYQSVAALAMAYAKMVQESRKRLATFSFRVGCAPELDQPPLQQPQAQQRGAVLQKISSSKNRWKTQGVSWIGFVFVRAEDVSNRSGYEAACRDLKLLMAPRLFTLTCLHRSSARNRRSVVPPQPPVIFEIEFVHPPSSTEHNTTDDAPEKQNDNNNNDNNDDDDDLNSGRPLSVSRGETQQEGNCDITECLINVLAQVIDEHPK